MDKIHVHQESSQGNIRIKRIGSDAIHIAKVDTAIVNIIDTPYEGITEVESHLYNPIVLETKYKTMQDNVTVLPITILDVDNPAGGYTVTIGKF